MRSATSRQRVEGLLWRATSRQRVEGLLWRATSRQRVEGKLRSPTLPARWGFTQSRAEEYSFVCRRTHSRVQ